MLNGECYLSSNDPIYLKSCIINIKFYYLKHWNSSNMFSIVKFYGFFFNRPGCIDAPNAPSGLRSWRQIRICQVSQDSQCLISAVRGRSSASACTKSWDQRDPEVLHFVTCDVTTSRRQCSWGQCMRYTTKSSPPTARGEGRHHCNDGFGVQRTWRVYQAWEANR